MNRTRKGTTRICAGIWTALLALMLTMIPLSASAAPGTSQGRGAENRSARATAALQAAQDLFAGIRRSRGHAAPKSAEARAQAIAAGENATLVLRNLAVSMNDLTPTQQLLARRILARPTDTYNDGPDGVKYPAGAPTGDTCTLPDQATYKVCVTWDATPPPSDTSTSTDPNPPAPTDDNKNGVPDWVETTQQVFDHVWQKEVVDLGYRAPDSDLGTVDPGVDSRTDVYLADLGPGLYGYCAPDYVDGRVRSYPAYCVVDNDFAKTEFPNHTPLQNLEVTAAHEFFHAIQFGYNVYADTWLMEGTAAWMEDEVYTDVNDNLQYLSRSPLSSPATPLDYVAPDTSTDPGAFAWRYGSWIWWRFLSEYFGSRGAQDPSVVRQVWRRVGAGEGTLQAVRGVIAHRNKTFGGVFADFGAINRNPRAWYDEGASYTPYVAAPGGRLWLTRWTRETGWMVTKLPHLANQHVVLRPGASLTGSWWLRVDLNLPDRYRGSQATAVVHRTDGRTKWVRVALDRYGDARFSVPFGTASVSNVVLTVTNASTRFTQCNSGTLWSCEGTPLDDGSRGQGLPFQFDARAVR